MGEAVLPVTSPSSAHYSVTRHSAVRQLSLHKTEPPLEHSLKALRLCDSRQILPNFLVRLGFWVCKMGSNNIYLAKFLLGLKRLSMESGLQKVPTSTNFHWKPTEAYATGQVEGGRGGHCVPKEGEEGKQAFPQCHGRDAHQRRAEPEGSLKTSAG